MKAHEILYIISVFLIILSIAFYMFSTTVFTEPEDDSVSTILGKNSVLDSTLTADEMTIPYKELERERNSIFLWVGVLGGILIFIIALIIKRIKQGKDLFIDHYDEDELEMY